MSEVAVFVDLQEADWRWKHFTRDDLKCKGSGECRMDPEFLDVLEAIREEYGSPMVITSGYRSPTYNAKVSYTGTAGPHTTGRAVDVSIRGKNALRLLKIALAHGVTGVGVAQKGNSRFLHLDMVDGVSRPMIWSY